MSGEIIKDQPESLNARCAKLIPGWWDSELCLMIGEQEAGINDTPEDREEVNRVIGATAQRVLAIGEVDPASEQGQELIALVAELQPPEQS